jgi:hypothetical protein
MAGDRHTPAGRGPERRGASVAVIAMSISCVAFMVFVESSFLRVESDGEDGLISITDVSKIRNLPVSVTLETGFIDRDEFADVVRVLMEADGEMMLDLREMSDNYHRCLYMEESPDATLSDDEWLDSFILQYSSGVAAFYDTDQEEMYVIGREHTNQYVNWLLSHELTHALQDQNFDLDSYVQNDMMLSEDRDMARMSVVEGDAKFTEGRWVDENLNEAQLYWIDMEAMLEVGSFIGNYYLGSSFGSMISAPGGLASPFHYTDGLTLDDEDLPFEYNYGKKFVTNVYEDSGWEGVNALFTTKPPLSTEHIIHYDKYVSYDEPHDVVYDGWDGGLDLQFEYTGGEYMLSEVLTSGSLTQMWAEGWGGDRFYYYEDYRGDFLGVLKTSWDMAQDNQNFIDNYLNALNHVIDGEDWQGIHSSHDTYLYIDQGATETTFYFSDDYDIVENFV